MTEKIVSKKRQLPDLAIDPLFGGAIITSCFGKGPCGEVDFTSFDRHPAQLPRLLSRGRRGPISPDRFHVFGFGWQLPLSHQ